MPGEAVDRNTFLNGLRLVSDAVGDTAKGLDQKRKPRTGDFARDILSPETGARSIIAKLQESLGLLAQIASERGLRLPTGDVIKVNLDEGVRDAEVRKMSRGGTDTDSDAKRDFPTGATGYRVEDSIEISRVTGQDSERMRMLDSNVKPRRMDGLNRSDW